MYPYIPQNLHMFGLTNLKLASAAHLAYGIQSYLPYLHPNLQTLPLQSNKSSQYFHMLMFHGFVGCSVCLYYHIKIG